MKKTWQVTDRVRLAVAGKKDPKFAPGGWAYGVGDDGLALFATKRFMVTRWPKGLGRKYVGAVFATVRARAVPGTPTPPVALAA